MATYNNLTNIGEYQKTSFPFSSEPLTGGSIYGKMKENEPIILPTTYEDSNGIIEEPKIYETIYYDDNDNKINPPYQNKDTTVFNKDDFSSSLTVTVYNTNDNLTSDQLENTERKFYNNVMSNSNISHEISEETNYNNIINNKSIEIGENLNIDNLVYNQFQTTGDNYNYTNIIDNKTDTFTDNINNNIIFGNDNILNTNSNELNDFNTYSKTTKDAYKDLSYEVDSKNENVSYQLNIITNDGQSMEYDNYENISNLMKTEEIKPVKDNNPFEYHPQQEYINNENNENIYETNNIVENQNQVEKKEEMKEEKKEVNIEEEKKAVIKEIKMEDEKEEKEQTEEKEEKKVEKKEEKKEDEKSKVKKRSIGTQTDEDNIKCIYNYTSRKMYKPRKQSFEKYNNNDYYYKTNYREYKRGKIFPVYDFNTYDTKNKKKSHSKRKQNVNVFFNPIRKIKIHRHKYHDNNYFQTNNNTYDDYIQTNSYLFNAGNIELNPAYTLPKNKSEIFSNNININDIPDNNYNFEYNLTNNNEQVGNDVIINQNYDNININTETYGDNFNYENITNEFIENGIKNSEIKNNENEQKKIFNMFQNKNNESNDNLELYDNITFPENYENYGEHTDNNYNA